MSCVGIMGRNIDAEPPTEEAYDTDVFLDGGFDLFGEDYQELQTSA